MDMYIIAIIIMILLALLTCVNIFSFVYGLRKGQVRRKRLHLIDSLEQRNELLEEKAEEHLRTMAALSKKILELYDVRNSIGNQSLLIAGCEDKIPIMANGQKYKDALNGEMMHFNLVIADLQRLVAVK